MARRNQKELDAQHTEGPTRGTQLARQVEAAVSQLRTLVEGKKGKPEPEIAAPQEQALEPEIAAPQEQALEPEIAAPQEQAPELESAVSQEQAPELESAVSQEQAPEPENAVSPEQALELESAVSPEQALEPESVVSPEQAPEPENVVQSEQPLVEAEEIRQQLAEERQVLEAEKAALARQQRELAVGQELCKRKLSAEFAPWLTGETVEESTQRMDTFEALFQEAVAQEMSSRMRGAGVPKAPKVSCGYSREELRNMTRQEINANWAEVQRALEVRG